MAQSRAGGTRSQNQSNVTAEDAIFNHALFGIVAIVIGLVLATAMIVLAGGPPTAIAHFMYAPIFLSAFRFGPNAGLICGLAGGVLAGPIAGIAAVGGDIVNTHQITEWVIRGAWFAGVGAALGAAFAYARGQARSLDLHLHTDESTALPNLKAARKYIESTRLAKRPDQDVLVKALRVLNYQGLVDTLGHEQAELAMKAFAKRLRSVLPRGTFVSRTGADAFTIIDWIGRQEGIERYVNRVQGIDQGTVNVGDVAVHVDTALGLVRYPSKDADAGKMFAQAEVAAARADTGNSAYKVYDPAEDSRRRSGARLVGEVESAIDTDQLKLVYQPKLHLDTRRFRGLEALARWDHPQRGAVSPGEFIPLVEQTRAIDGFTRWVLREAIKQAAEWRSKGYTPSVAVNISTRNLTNDSLLRYVQELLDRYSLAASGLELEITESALMNVPEARVDLLKELRSKGVRIAVDDFGTGYASLAYLRDLPLDILKLDQSFIRTVSHRKPDLMMVRRIIQMAKDLGLEVVGEGVEDAKTLKVLHDLGCDHVQGFYIARPLPSDRIERLLSTAWSSDRG